VGSALYFYVFSLLGLFLIIISSINYVNLSIADFDSRTKEMGGQKNTGSKKEANRISGFHGHGIRLLAGLAYQPWAPLLPLSKDCQFAELGSPIRNAMGWKGNGACGIDHFIFDNAFFCIPCLSPFFSKTYEGLETWSGIRIKRQGTFADPVFYFYHLYLRYGCRRQTLRLFSEKDLGYDRNNLMYLIMPGQYPPEKVSLLKNEISKLVGVESASYTWYPMTSVYFKDWYDVEMDGKMTKILLNEMFVDHDF